MGTLGSSEPSHGTAGTVAACRPVALCACTVGAKILQYQRSQGWCSFKDRYCKEAELPHLDGNEQKKDSLGQVCWPGRFFMLVLAGLVEQCAPKLEGVCSF